MYFPLGCGEKMNSLYLLEAFLIGVLLACQTPINTIVANAFGAPYAATDLFIRITLVANALVMFFTKTTFSMMKLFILPWWVILVGFFGISVVAGGIVIIPLTGVALLFVCLIAGQFAGSVLLEHVGAFQLSFRVISFTKTARILVTFGGVLIVRYGNKYISQAILVCQITYKFYSLMEFW